MAEDLVQATSAAAATPSDHPGRVTDDPDSAQAISLNQAFTQLREKLAANRQPIDRAERYAFPRGWNEAFDFVEKCLKEMLGET